MCTSGSPPGSMLFALILLAFATVMPFATHAQAGGGDQDATRAEGGSILAPEALEELVAPIALYPDDLLAIVLPASTYPLDIVQAARFLDRRKSNPDLKPDEKWDTSVLGLLKYPEVVDRLNSNLDWTWQLGEAVINQQEAVMDAIQQFRQTAHTAGNLPSNEQQVIVEEKETIIIQSADPEVIYVPRYDPAVVVVRQPSPYVYYYSSPYPYYYSPAAAFWTGAFVGAGV